MITRNEALEESSKAYRLLNWVKTGLTYIESEKDKGQAKYLSDAIDKLLKERQERCMTVIARIDAHDGFPEFESAEIALCAPYDILSCLQANIKLLKSWDVVTCDDCLLWKKDT